MRTATEYVHTAAAIFIASLAVFGLLVLLLVA